jgi:hypothetical protein
MLSFIRKRLSVITTTTTTTTTTTIIIIIIIIITTTAITFEMGDIIALLLIRYLHGKI